MYNVCLRGHISPTEHWISWQNLSTYQQIHYVFSSLLRSTLKLMSSPSCNESNSQYDYQWKRKDTRVTSMGSRVVVMVTTFGKAKDDYVITLKILFQWLWGGSLCGLIVMQGSRWIRCEFRHVSTYAERSSQCGADLRVKVRFHLHGAAAERWPQCGADFWFTQFSCCVFPIWRDRGGCLRRVRWNGSWNYFLFRTAER